MLRPGLRVLDLGCWPGGWLQVAGRVVGPSGRVVGVDLAAIEGDFEYENTVAIEGDLGDPSICERVLESLGGPADLVISDAAPKLTGVREVDRASEERLLEAVAGLLPVVLREGGDLVLKLLESPEAREVDGRIRARFTRARSARVAATRKGSSERYLVARGFRGATGPQA